MPWGSLAANTVCSFMRTNENAPDSMGKTVDAARSSPSSRWRARSVATRSESVVARPRGPTWFASSALGTRAATTDLKM